MQFAFGFSDPYLSTMACTHLKTQGQNMTFTEFELSVSMFRLHTKLPKVKLPQIVLACLKY